MGFSIKLRVEANYLANLSGRLNRDFWEGGFVFSNMTLKDYILIALGFVLGGYASLIASRIVVWLHLKHDTFYRIELVSGIINGQSFEFAPHAHKPDRLLEARAIEFYFHGS